MLFGMPIGRAVFELVQRRSLQRRGRRGLLFLTLLLPSGLKISILRLLPGWKIGNGVQIGLSYLDSEIVDIGEGVHIGHFNIVRNVQEFRLGPSAHIKNFNSFFGAATIAEFGFVSCVRIGARVLFMSHHFIDCAGTFTIEDDVTFGGRSTEVYTHQRNLHEGVPRLEPTAVFIGQGTYVAARCTLVSCVVPPGTVIGAGAVVVGDHRSDVHDGPVLLAGNPAIVRKRYGQTPA